MTDYTKKSLTDLKEMLTKAREELRAFRFGEAGAHTRDVRKGRTLRKDIARMLTQINSGLRNK